MKARIQAVKRASITGSTETINSAAVTATTSAAASAKRPAISRRRARRGTSTSSSRSSAAESAGAIRSGRLVSGIGDGGSVPRSVLGCAGCPARWVRVVDQPRQRRALALFLQPS